MYVYINNKYLLLYKYIFICMYIYMLIKFVNKTVEDNTLKYFLER